MSVGLPRLVLVTNIPSPYRLHAFAVLHRELQQRGVALEVLFMADTEPGRYWQANPETWRFSGRTVAGAHPNWLGMSLHWNPKIWMDILHRPPTWLVIGGGWQLPTSLGLYSLKSLLRHTTILAWAEANASSSTYLAGPVAVLRQKLLNSAKAIIIPGQVANKTLRETWKVTRPLVFQWPNLVDETIFRDRVAELRLRRDALRQERDIPPHQRVLFWSARLEEHTKGILTFLKEVETSLGLHTTILIAGEGPDRLRIEHWLANHPKLDIRLMGHVQESEMVACLALADVVLLPSLRDPNPLSAIEALWAGLPLLTSVHCGNWPETVLPGENGWVINPTDGEQLREAISEIQAASAEHLAALGAQSQAIAEMNFDSTQATRQLVNMLLTAFPPQEI